MVPTNRQPRGTRAELDGVSTRESVQLASICAWLDVDAGIGSVTTPTKREHTRFGRTHNARTQADTFMNSLMRFVDNRRVEGLCTSLSR
ncbi:hypothetical protein Ae201684P_019549 [Aphanomyces euteiches]|uniref:Uncharacterized protein n=1 Tax=Aphanomyces euteiches TaxID=100861 RepID=A0A6G0WIZ7_9STRA|nr:hypothetical protein Ae201684_014731 [Aphanomyces euteiches]KAH9078464.1 hypothetical protein Ae201684P_019549 [Aphanomyces euteiches]